MLNTVRAYLADFVRDEPLWLRVCVALIVLVAARFGLQLDADEQLVLDVVALLALTWWQRRNVTPLAKLPPPNPAPAKPPG